MALTKDRKKQLVKLAHQTTEKRGMKLNSQEELHFLLATIVYPTPPVAPPQSAPDVLHKAAAIMEDRAKQYDQPEGERSMGKTVAAFGIVTGVQLKESDGWYFMEMLKNVRQYQNPTYHQDSAEDGVAYSALKAEALEKEQ